MSNNYNGELLTAQELIAEFGQPVTISRLVPSDYDPATGSASMSSVTESGFGVLLELNTMGGGWQNAPGSLIIGGDKQLLLSTAGISVPQLDDSVLVNGVIYTLVVIKPLAPGGLAIFYDCTIRA